MKKILFGFLTSSLARCFVAQAEKVFCSSFYWHCLEDEETVLKTVLYRRARNKPLPSEFLRLLSENGNLAETLQNPLLLPASGTVQKSASKSWRGLELSPRNSKPIDKRAKHCFSINSRSPKIAYVIYCLNKTMYLD